MDCYPFGAKLTWKTTPQAGQHRHRYTSTYICFINDFLLVPDQIWLTYYRGWRDSGALFSFKVCFCRPSIASSHDSDYLLSSCLPSIIIIIIIMPLPPSPTSTFPVTAVLLPRSTGSFLTSFEPFYGAPDPTFIPSPLPSSSLGGGGGGDSSGTNMSLINSASLYRTFFSPTVQLSMTPYTNK